MTFYRGDAEEGNELGEQPANVTNGMATCTIDASNWEIADYTITAVHTPAEGDGPVQLVGTGSAVLTVLAEVPETYYWIGPAQELADFRDMLGTSRKYALAVLEYYDKNKILKKDGDLRRMGLGFQGILPEES